VEGKEGGGEIANLLPEHLQYSQNIRMGSARAFLEGFTGGTRMTG